jgi:NADH:ubiquinone oxidoreductase subunit 3 (subunit A)
VLLVQLAKLQLQQLVRAVLVQRLACRAYQVSRGQQQAHGVHHRLVKISLVLLLLLLVVVLFTVLLLLQIHRRMQQMDQQMAGECGSEPWTLVMRQQQQAQVAMQQLLLLVLERQRQVLLGLGMQRMALAVRLLLQQCSRKAV